VGSSLDLYQIKQPEGGGAAGRGGASGTGEVNQEYVYSVVPKT